MASVRHANPNRICTSGLNDCRFLTVKATLSTGSKALFIPMFQRRYCWGPSSLKKFWSDVERASRDPLRHHNLHMIILSDQKGKIVVVDGQQRLTTSTLLLASLRDAAKSFEREGDSRAQRAARFREDINSLIFRNGKNGSRLQRLVPSLADRAAYAKCVALGGAALSTHGAAARDSITRARLTFDQFVRDRLQAPKNGLDFLIKLATGLIDRCKLLNFKIEQKDLWSVYERIAYRQKAIGATGAGVGCAEADLARNYLMSFFADEKSAIEVYKNLWLPLEKLVEKSAAAPSAPRSRQRKGSDATLGHAFDVIVGSFLKHRTPKSDESSPPKPKDKHGGAFHLQYQSAMFPTYLKLRQQIEAILRRKDLDVTAADAGSERRVCMAAGAMDVVRGFMQDMLTYASKGVA